MLRRTSVLAITLLVSVTFLAGPSHAARRRPGLPRDADTELLEALGDDFEVLPTKHFLIYYDTTESFARHRRFLLENLREVYSESFEKIGVEILKSHKRLAVILFDTEDGFKTFLNSPDLEWAAGVYVLGPNHVVFFDGSTDPEYLEAKKQIRLHTGELLKMRRQLRQLRNAVRKGQYTRLISSRQKRIKGLERKLDGIIKNQNVSVTIHEAAHQLCFNLGPFDRETFPPRWLCEGAATFFETPRMGQWRGAARFNAPRYVAYESARKEGKIASLERILTDESVLLDAEEVDGGYGAVWSVFYFLYNEYGDACADILRTFRSPADGIPEDDPARAEYNKTVLDDFERILGKPVTEVEAEWHAYMDRCAKDFERDIEGWERSITP